MNEKKVNNTFEHLFKHESSLYDDFLTGRTWYAKLFNYVFWHQKDMCSSEKILFDMFPPNFNGKLLDVPCGTGVFTKNRYLKMQNAKIVCLDYSNEMIERFKNALKGNEEKVQHISFCQGDVVHLPYEDESFDIVLSMNGYQCFPEKEKALKEMKRVLKKEGLLIGSAYIKGKYFLSDLLVKIYDAKHIMIAPHENESELKLKLEKYFEIKFYQSTGSVSHFACIKH